MHCTPSRSIILWAPNLFFASAAPVLECIDICARHRVSICICSELPLESFHSICHWLGMLRHTNADTSHPAAHTHPSFKATLTGLRKTRLRKVQICPRLAETKRKNIFSDHMNSRICLGSPRYWLHKFDQNITKTGSLVIFWHSWLAAGTNNHLISLHHPK